MDVRSIYGVADSGAATAGDDSAAADDQPGLPADNQASPAAASETAQQPAAQSATAQATEAINDLLSGAPQPISSAVMTQSSHNADPAESSAAAPKKLGFIRALLRGSSTAATDQAPQQSQSTAAQPAGESPDASNDDEDNAAPVESRLLKHKHFILGGVATVVVLLAAIAVGAINGRGNNTDVAAPPAAAGGRTSLNTAASSGRQRDKPVPVEVSTTAPPRCPGTSSTDAANAISGDASKAWTCARAYNADGALLTLTLPDGPYYITSVRLVPGFDFTGPDKVDQWFQYRTVSEAVWRFDDGTRVEQQFDGSRRQQSAAVNGAWSSTVTLQIIKTDLAAPTKATTSNTQSAPGFLEGWGSINLPDPDHAEAPQTPHKNDEPSAFAVSSIEVVGHPAR